MAEPQRRPAYDVTDDAEPLEARGALFRRIAIILVIAIGFGLVLFAIDYVPLIELIAGHAISDLVEQHAADAGVSAPVLSYRLS